MSMDPDQRARDVWRKQKAKQRKKKADEARGLQRGPAAAALAGGPPDAGALALELMKLQHYYIRHAFLQQLAYAQSYPRHEVALLWCFGWPVACRAAGRWPSDSFGPAGGMLEGEIEPASVDEVQRLLRPLQCKPWHAQVPLLSD